MFTFNLLSFRQFKKKRTFSSITTQSSCFKRPGVNPGLLQKRILYDITAVLPGPQIVLASTSKKFGQFGKSSANFTKTSMQSFAPFLPLLGTFGQIFFFFSAPFKPFGWNFGHLATLRHSWRDGGAGGASLLYTQNFSKIAAVHATA